MVREYDLSERAEAQVDRIAEDLTLKLGSEISGRFLDGLTAALEKELVFVTNGRRALAAESTAVRADLYAITYRGGGFWRVTYRLLDRDEDGEVDFLEVFSVVSATGGSVRP